MYQERQIWVILRECQLNIMRGIFFLFTNRATLIEYYAWSALAQHFPFKIQPIIQSLFSIPQGRHDTQLPPLPGKNEVPKIGEEFLWKPAPARRQQFILTTTASHVCPCISGTLTGCQFLAQGSCHWNSLGGGGPGMFQRNQLTLPAASSILPHWVPCFVHEWITGAHVLCK